MISLQDIKPYDKNAKEHPEEQVELIAYSLKRWGWRQPVVVNRDKVIIAGHGRMLAFNKYPDQIKEPWVIDEEGKTLLGSPETTPFASPEDEKAYRLADNQLNQMSGYDGTILIPELRELDSAGLDITLLGFNYDLITEENEMDDVIPETPEPKAKLGDVFEIGAHRVVCGDSTNEEVWKKLMDGKKADMVFTDPPYNVNYHGSGENTSNTIMGDNLDEGAFGDLLQGAFGHMSRYLKAGGGAYIFHSHHSQNEFRDQLELCGLEIKNQLIWNKPSLGLGGGDYRPKHEPFFYAAQKGQKPLFYGDRTNSTVLDLHETPEKLVAWAKKIKKLEKEGKTTIWSLKRENVNEYSHPTQKPVELVQQALFNSSKQEDIVVDPFLGSGSTLIACEKAGRICFGLELDPKYVDVIVQRWVDYVGNETIKLNGEEIHWPKSEAKDIEDGEPTE